MVGHLSFIDAIASEQWALVTRAQLIEGGFKRGQIARLLERGVLRIARPSVYATVGSVPSWQQTLLAEVLSVGHGALASHASAARLWEFVYQPEEAVTVLIESDFSCGSRSTRRTTVLPADDVTTRSGIPCTSFERTLCDCTTLLTS